MVDVHMNIVRQWFPSQFEKAPEEQLIENMCLVMAHYGMSKKEFDDLTIPEYLIMRDCAFEQIKQEHETMNKMFAAMSLKRRGR
jgi:hypothetical protein